MAYEHFNPPVFIKQKHETSINIVQTPFFYNNAGIPSYVAQLPANANLLTPVATNPNLAIGNPYVVSEIIGVKQCQTYGVETQLGFVADQVTYAPMWVTKDIAAAFGIILVAPGEAVTIQSPVDTLSQVEYEYGVFAGHWSPYHNTGDHLLSVVCTDLEHHDFPHVFASTDATFPLVTSVARYWPSLSKICLADLWVPRGSALYIPPKPATPNQTYIDLHNNRNSAHACWGNIKQSSITTDTLLQLENGFFYWYWNASPSVHHHLNIKT